jgi:predicted nucleic acid-binding protein
LPSRQVCIDASVALKLVVVEDDSGRARSLWRGWALHGVSPVAPALMLFECVSALRRLVARGVLAQEAARVSLDRLLEMPVAFPAPDGLVEKTWELAGRFERPHAYDSFYLALAELLGVPFWTADRRLYNAVHAALPWVHHLDEQPQ